jgi:hypothetical protein
VTLSQYAGDYDALQGDYFFQSDGGGDTLWGGGGAYIMDGGMDSEFICGGLGDDLIGRQVDDSIFTGMRDDRGLC